MDQQPWLTREERKARREIKRGEREKRTEYRREKRKEQRNEGKDEKREKEEKGEKRQKRADAANILEELPHGISTFLFLFFYSVFAVLCEGACFELNSICANVSHFLTFSLPPFPLFLFPRSFIWFKLKVFFL
jgi:hypothetical protein